MKLTLLSPQLANFAVLLLLVTTIAPAFHASYSTLINQPSRKFTGKFIDQTIISRGKRNPNDQGRGF